MRAGRLRMQAWLRGVTSRWRGEGGITLMETVVAIGIVTLALGLVGVPLFSVLRVSDPWREDLTATANLRAAAGHLARDAVNAQAISLADGSPPVDTIEMLWFLVAPDATRTVDYKLEDGLLLRAIDGTNSVAARRVESVSFMRDGNLLTMTLVVHGGNGATESVDSVVALRRLEE